jgi:ATP-binding cassette subfamily F protein 3
LSGGERARLLLNLVAMSAPHLLILDEPTNHLDIDSRRALLDALNDYEGAVILITHDRSLIELVADRLWLTADGRVKPFPGDMDEYARFVIERARLGAAPSQTDAAPSAADESEEGGAESFDAGAAARLAAKKAAKKRRRRGL